MVHIKQNLKKKKKKKHQDQHTLDIWMIPSDKKPIFLIIRPEDLYPQPSRQQEWDLRNLKYKLPILTPLPSVGSMPWPLGGGGF